ncbi:MAG TPA: hypothetical protein VK211_07550 [Kamptonema sp.]|nr:hypothetical protein [Kamptonema sp.]
MLSFKIELDELEEEIDIYSRGHITVQGNSGIISSKLSKRNQSMMIFISLCELLNSVRVLLTSPIKKTYNFVGVGCSFQFFIVKKASNKLILTSVKNEVIDEFIYGELVEEIWREVKIFMLKYGNLLAQKGIVYNDLTYSLKEFKKQFNLQ